MSPFVGSWHPLVESFDRLRPPPPDVSDLLRSFQQSITDLTARRTSSLRGFERRVAAALAHRDPVPARGANFARVSQLMIYHLAQLAYVREKEKVAYLKPLIEHSRKIGRLFIATLNYDNSIELAAAVEGVECNSAIPSWSRNQKLDFSLAGLNLAKLHGSIDWQWVGPATGSDILLPRRGIRVLGPGAAAPRPGTVAYRNFEPAVIFGHKNKLTAEGPFLGLLQAFVEELDEAETLTVIGYSFGDPHINVYIGDWLHRSERHRLRIVDPVLERVPVGRRGELWNFGGSTAGKTELIGEKASTAIAKLFA